MHISLDSALGRQRRLNSVGESVFQIAPNAAAGYSLRSLTGGDPAVVRVRRESDNAERDFNASGVSSGELVNWVNQQITPPLDLRELTATGRDGPIIDAAAAYSLRNLSDSYTGNVVDVRRSSDDATRSFTAAEIADGTLTDWVNTDVSFSAGNDFFSATGVVVINATPTAFDATSAGGTFDVRAGGQNYVGAGASEVTVNFTVSNFSSSQSIALEAWTPDGSGTYVTAGTITGNGAYTFTFDVTEDGTGSIFRFRGTGLTSGDTVSVSGLSLSWTKASGHVSQWYDQSTTAGTPNANHAVQTDAAKQPKIVDAGSLVTGGIDFDGVNYGLEFDEESVITNMDDFSSFTVAKSNTTSGTKIALAVSDDTPNASRWYSPILIGGNFTFGYGTSATAVSLGTADTNEHLFSSIAGSTTAEAWKDGTSGGSVSSVTTAPSIVSGINLGGSNNALLWNGSIKEIILYNTDQSDNRTAIEANIGEVYGIAGIPAYDDTVNGFVESWYDQSGNDNDATQLTASYQPKIVDAGVLVTGGILSDGAGTFLELDSTLSISDECDIFFTGIATASDWTGLQRSPYGFSTNSDYPRFNDDSFRYTISSSDSGTIDYNSGFTIGAGTPFLYNFNRDVSDSVGAQINGTAQTNRVTLTGTHQISQLFRRGTNTSQVWDGTMSEMIFYPSDQSANRPAIEANINNQYDIY